MEMCIRADYLQTLGKAKCGEVAYRVLFWVISESNKDLVVFASQSDMAKEIGFSRQSVNRGMSELKKIKAVKAIGTRCYELNKLYFLVEDTE